MEKIRIFWRENESERAKRRRRQRRRRRKRAMNRRFEAISINWRYNINALEEHDDRFIVRKKKEADGDLVRDLYVKTKEKKNIQMSGEKRFEHIMKSIIESFN